MAQLVEHATLDLYIMSSSPTLGIDYLKKKKHMRGAWLAQLEELATLDFRS